MLRITTTAALLGCFAAPAPAASSDSAWTVTKSETEVRYALTTGESKFVVICTSPKFGGGVFVDVVIRGIDPAPWTETRVLLDDEEFHIKHGQAGIGVTDCQECSDDFNALWSLLRQPTAEKMRVVIGERSAPFSVQGGDTVLGDCTTDYDRLIK